MRINKKGKNMFMIPGIIGFGLLIAGYLIPAMVFIMISVIMMAEEVDCNIIERWMYRIATWGSSIFVLSVLLTEGNIL